MNFLAHHAVARRAAPDAAPELFAGNLLPDLISMAGDGRLRETAVPANEDPLARGALLHFFADRTFHSSAAFKAATDTASQQLRRTPFSEPPRRLFFVAHVFVELALDAAILRHAPDTAADLYGRLARVSPEAVGERVAVWLGRAPGEPPMQLPDLLRRFVAARYLEDYRQTSGLTEALRRINRRVGLENFAAAADGAPLAAAFAHFAPEADELRESLFGSGPFGSLPTW